MFNFCDKYALHLISAIGICIGCCVYYDISYENSCKFEIRIGDMYYYTNNQPIYDKETNRLIFEHNGRKIETTQFFTIEERK